MLEKIARLAILALILVVFVAQLSSLYVFPMPDGARWWGDETGQMIELKTELQEGQARIPIGMGSTVAVTNGILRGNSWLAALVYGFPALVFSNVCDVVGIGRTVTAILSGILLLALYFVLKKFGASTILAEFGVLALVSTRSFLFASHAARLDVAAGLVLLLYIAYISATISKVQSGKKILSSRWFVGFGALTFLLATLSIHLLTLLVLPALYALWKLGAFRDPQKLIRSVAGVVTVGLLIFILYVVSGAPITMLGVTSHRTQFHSVIEEIPITKLFSRSVQIANLHQRWDGMVHEAPTILALFLIGCIVTAITFRRKKNDETDAPILPVSLVLAVIVSWLLFQSYAIYYYVHVLPILVLFAILAIARVLDRKKSIMAIACLAASFLVAHLGFYDALNARASGKQLTTANREALAAAFKAPELHNSDQIILTQNPALAWMLKNSRMQVMSPHFLEFPVDDRTPAETLKALHVKYLALYLDPSIEDYSGEVLPLKHVADSLGTPIATETGTLIDVGRNYFRPDFSRIDTLRIYRLPF